MRLDTRQAILVDVVETDKYTEYSHTIQGITTKLMFTEKSLIPNQLLTDNTVLETTIQEWIDTVVEYNSNMYE